jgi:hypothetical protein
MTWAQQFRPQPENTGEPSTFTPFQPCSHDEQESFSQDGGFDPDIDRIQTGGRNTMEHLGGYGVVAVLVIDLAIVAPKRWES